MINQSSLTRMLATLLLPVLLVEYCVLQGQCVSHPIGLSILH
eukprot:COSAG02_NODE_6459_length_3558_cov_2.711477_4_plen_41_part_01